MSLANAAGMTTKILIRLSPLIVSPTDCSHMFAQKLSIVRMERSERVHQRWSVLPPLIGTVKIMCTCLFSADQNGTHIDGSDLCKVVTIYRHLGCNRAREITSPIFLILGNGAVGTILSLVAAIRVVVLKTWHVCMKAVDPYPNRSFAHVRPKLSVWAVCSVHVCRC